MGQLGRTHLGSKKIREYEKRSISPHPLLLLHSGEQAQATLSSPWGQVVLWEGEVEDDEDLRQ